MRAASAFLGALPTLAGALVGMAISIHLNACLRAERRVAGSGIVMLFAPIWLPATLAGAYFL